MFERRSAGVICHSLTQCTLVSSEERERDIFWSLLIIDTPILNLNRTEVASHCIIRTVRISELKKKNLLGDHRRGIFTWTTHTRTRTHRLFFSCSSPNGTARRSARRLHRSRIAIPLFRARAQRAQLHAFIHPVDDGHALRAVSPSGGDGGGAEEEAFTKTPSVQRQARDSAQRHVSPVPVSGAAPELHTVHYNTL